MAKAAACRRAVLLGTNSVICFTRFNHFNGSNAANVIDCLSPDSSIRLSNSFALKSSPFNRFDCRLISQLVKSNGKHAFLVDTLALSEMTQESSLSKFKSEVKSSQEHHFSMLQRETEKLRGDIEKMRSELRYEIDKVTAGQRLDLNLERGRIRDELANQNAETTNLTNKLDREIHALRAQLEAAKYDVIKYCIGTLVSISAVGLAVVRILM
ncbi:PREDICTED: protein FMP32, mitochondrial isoform X6 [Nelumbo nucifera]|uniref:Protein FMP32, mitochondrial isoform X6 n=1 Tax=Nelumbo nucifera TaxID=4432 RepID=A0A1U8Q5M1_NELNU|nr:PREDICTED: protein FMP32, mitochondrial isoform X6 [Nelumbo nucifera]